MLKLKNLNIKRKVVNLDFLKDKEQIKNWAPYPKVPVTKKGDLKRGPLFILAVSAETST